MHKFLLASGNPHKAEELNKLLDPALFFIEPAPEKLHVPEPGKTYRENALFKAEAYYQKYQRPCVSDDSGMEVPALPGEMGVESANFGGEGISDQKRCELLLQKLDGRTDRDASFVCTLCFYLSPDEIYFFEGVLKGSVAQTCTGSEGFGYDPLFTPEGKAEGESLATDIAWKEKNSHRAQAASKAREFFAERRCQTT